MEPTFEPTAKDCLAMLEGAMRLEGRFRTGAEPCACRAEVSLAIAAAMAICRLYVANARSRISLH